MGPLITCAAQHFFWKDNRTSISISISGRLICNLHFADDIDTNGELQDLASRLTVQIHIE